jgi:hypothetical protein
MYRTIYYIYITVKTYNSDYITMNMNWATCETSIKNIKRQIGIGPVPVLKRYLTFRLYNDKYVLAHMRNVDKEY